MKPIDFLPRFNTAIKSKSIEYEMFLALNNIGTFVRKGRILLFTFVVKYEVINDFGVFPNLWGKTSESSDNVIRTSN